MVHPVGDGLADTDGRRQQGEMGANIREDFVAGARGRPEIHVDLAEVNALGVLVELRPPGAPAQ